MAERRQVGSGEFYLPEEILTNIISYCHPSSLQDLQTLSSLSQSSKLLNRLVEPQLYSIFPGQRVVNPRLWWRGVLARPGRGEGVRGVKIDEFVRWRRGLDWEGEGSGEGGDGEDVTESGEDMTGRGDGEEVGDEEDGEIVEDGDGERGNEEDGDEEHAEDENEENEGEDEAGDDEADGSQDGKSSSDEDEEEEEDLEKLTLREIQLLSKETFGKLEDSLIPALQDLIHSAKMKPRTRQKLLTALEEETHHPERINTNTDLLLSLLLLACPNLTTLTLSIPDTFDQSLLSLALTDRTGSIETINLHREGKRDVRSQGAVETLARLNIFGRREVRRLKVKNDDLSDIMDPGHEDIFGPWSSLAEISLQECVVPVPAMVILTEQSPNLKALEWQLENETPMETLGDILRELCPDLERLKYEIVDLDGKIEEEPAMGYSLQQGLYGLGDLSSLTRLKELEVPVWGLMTLGTGPRLKREGGLRLVEILPKGLEVLRVLSFGWEIGGVDVDEEVRKLKGDERFRGVDVELC